MRADVGLQDPAVPLYECRTTLRRLPVLQVHESAVSALGGGRPDNIQGEGGDSESGAARNDGSSDTEIRSGVAGGCTKLTTKMTMAAMEGTPEEMVEQGGV